MRRLTLLVALLALLLTLAACGGGEAAIETEPAESEGAGAIETEETEAAVPAASDEATETAPAPVAQAGGMLRTVQDRGNLICGVNSTLPGFGNVDAAGNYSGFDVDFCRAVAAAVLNDPNAVEFRPLNAQERFTAVQTGEVDLLIRNTTHTLSRDTSVGLDFAPTTFYDGQGMMVRADSGIETLEDLEGATVCVQTGTTTELNLESQFRARGIAYEPLVFQEADPTAQAYDEGQCDAFTTDKSGLVTTRTKLANPEEHVILDVTMSKEPLAPSYLQGDPQWGDIVNWVVWGTFQAEEFGITQENVEEMLDSEDPEIQRFLGQGDSSLGEEMGIENDFMVDVIRAVGNYEEIYNRNLGPETPFNLERGLNQLYTEGGLLYSPPFR
ncbi:MAG: amino acid ABC transporter substrate-binding protein [Chloroflexota bacterium]|nr:amino acid ABC transporter substrate-binding protein [Chloroflexota bacterium]